MYILFIVTASGTATFAGNDFTQELRLDMNLTAIGVSVNVDMGGNHTLSPVLELERLKMYLADRSLGYLSLMPTAMTPHLVMA